jgi:predicted AlkP superfamily phosphohydrolase/phosphomutase
MKKVAVIGLDGMSWSALGKLFSWKAMPNLDKISRASLKGILKSTIPPESGPAWTSIATGVNPGKHGIFSFTKPTEDFGDIAIMSSRDVKYLRVHEMVASQGLKSICVNQLFTYPIKNIPGSSIITDWLSPEIAFSSEIQGYAKNYNGPTLSQTSPMIKKNWETEYSEVSSRVDTINTMLQTTDWDLFWAIYSEPDHLFHRYFDRVIKNDQQIMRLFSKIDETFGIIENQSDLLIVVSDHGFKKFNNAVYLNTYLEKHGLISKKKKEERKKIVCQRQIDESHTKLYLPESLIKYLSIVPSKIERYIIRIYKQLLKADIKIEMTSHIDPVASSAFAYGFGIFVKKKNLIEYVLSLLKKAEFIGGVWKREELYSGNQLENMPDLIAIPKYEKGYALRSDAIAPKPVTRRSFSSHHPNGIVMIHQKNLQPSWTKEIKVYDIAPTILNYLDLQIPYDIDGESIFNKLSL